MIQLTESEALCLYFYIQNTEESLDGEYGLGRTFEELVQQGEIEPRTLHAFAVLEQQLGDILRNYKGYTQ